LLNFKLFYYRCNTSFFFYVLCFYELSFLTIPKVKLFNILRRKKLLLNIRCNRFIIRPCNRCIKRGLKCYIFDQLKLCFEYIVASCIFYLLIITEADWRRVRAKKRKLKKAFLNYRKKVIKAQKKLAFIKKSLLRIEQQQKKMFYRKFYNIEKLKRNKLTTCGDPGPFENPLFR